MGSSFNTKYIYLVTEVKKKGGAKKEKTAFHSATPNPRSGPTFPRCEIRLFVRAEEIFRQAPRRGRISTNG
jgi:hypothetical protein